jgi:hypothetical protein
MLFISVGEWREHCCEGVEIQGFSEMGTETGGPGARYVVPATKASDRDYGYMLAAVDLP